MLKVYRVVWGMVTVVVAAPPSGKGSLGVLRTL
jgi:hypothetical protein